MSAWDLSWLVVTAAGLLATLVLALEAWRDKRAAGPHLRLMARQVLRHELLRVVKQALLFVAVLLIYFRNHLGDTVVMATRNAIIGSVSTILTMNSLFDLKFRFRYFDKLRNEERTRLLRRDSKE